MFVCILPLYSVCCMFCSQRALCSSTSTTQTALTWLRTDRVWSTVPPIKPPCSPSTLKMLLKVCTNTLHSCWPEYSLPRKNTVILCFASGGLDLAIEGPSKAEISCVDNKDGTCTVSYLPTLPGDYNILVRYNDKHIAGSPFTARITGTGLKPLWNSLYCINTSAVWMNVTWLDCAEDNKRKSQVKLGSAADFSLDITETDLSLLTASIKAPSGRDEPCLLKRQPNNHIGMIGEICSLSLFANFHFG